MDGGALDAATLDVAGLRRWVGRSDASADIVAPRLEASLRALLDKPVGAPVVGDPATPAIHWCLSPPIVPGSELGADGHPARGGFLPPVPLPRRMWAGGELRFAVPLRVGDPVIRESTVADVAVKAGRSGALCFVTVRHRLSVAGELAIEERQDIVFRDGAGPPPTDAPERAEPRWRRTVACDPVLLFRYSALTFNGHRIHFDHGYATAREGYGGLVVHGPLQATMLLDLASEVRGGPPRAFAFRSVRPLIAAGAFTLNAVAEGPNLLLWASDAEGHATMRATARWA